MPVYLFTWHAHGSWMPDRRRGYVKRGQGILPADERMAERYRDRARQPAVVFTTAIGRIMIDTVRQACAHLDCTAHAIATDSSHLHVLVSWRHDRPWRSVRRSIRFALTKRLNEQVGPQRWFSTGASRRRVRDREHLDYLVSKYLPGHRGAGWIRARET